MERPGRYFMGDHEGVVLERFNWFFFLGLNRREPKEPTFMSVQWGPFSPETLLCGHAMIFTHPGLSVTTGCHARCAERHEPAGTLCALHKVYPPRIRPSGRLSRSPQTAVHAYADGQLSVASETIAGQS